MDAVIAALQTPELAAEPWDLLGMTLLLLLLLLLLFMLLLLLLMLPSVWS